jgi:hypothetical protein
MLEKNCRNVRVLFHTESVSLKLGIGKVLIKFVPNRRYFNQPSVPSSLTIFGILNSQLISFCSFIMMYMPYYLYLLPCLYMYLPTCLHATYTCHLLSYYMYRTYILYRSCICKPFKEPRNRFLGCRSGTTTLFVVRPARLHRLT